MAGDIAGAITADGATTGVGAMGWVCHIESTASI
jgi:hypothetical protein